MVRSVFKLIFVGFSAKSQEDFKHSTFLVREPANIRPLFGTGPKVVVCGNGQRREGIEYLLRAFTLVRRKLGLMFADQY